MKCLDIYKGIAQAESGIGETILFWKDMWNGRFFASHLSPSSFLSTTTTTTAKPFNPKQVGVG
jgi:hypothetical protein